MGDEEEEEEVNEAEEKKGGLERDIPGTENSRRENSRH